MKFRPTTLLAFAALACVAAAPALAQSPSPPSTPPAATSQPADEPGPNGGGVKAVRQACRADADAKGLKGPAKREAVSACVVQKRPDQAGREACRSQGFAKGLRKQELHAFVKDCAKPKG